MGKRISVVSIGTSATVSGGTGGETVNFSGTETEMASRF